MPEREAADREEGQRFLVDAMCGTLARYLRMCGHDAAYAPDRGVEADEAVVALAEREDRRVVTRDRDLAALADDAILLADRDVEGQLRTLADAGVRLALPETPRRCGACNGGLEAVGAAETTADYAPDPDEMAVWRCVACGQCFWRGSHWDDVATTLARVRSGADG